MEPVTRHADGPSSPDCPTAGRGNARAALRNCAWLIAAALVLAFQAFAAFDGVVIRSADPAPARADALGKGMVPLSLTAKPGILRAESGGAGGDGAWVIRADAQRISPQHGPAFAGRAFRTSAPAPNAALVHGARTPTGPPMEAA